MHRVRVLCTLSTQEVGTTSMTFAIDYGGGELHVDEAIVSVLSGTTRAITKAAFTIDQGLHNEPQGQAVPDEGFGSRSNLKASSDEAFQSKSRRVLASSPTPKAKLMSYKITSEWNRYGGWNMRINTTTQAQL